MSVSSRSRSSITLLLTSSTSVTSGSTVRSRVAAVSRTAIACGLPSSRTRIWPLPTSLTYSPFRSTWKRT